MTSSPGVFAEDVKTNSISIPSYLGRLILRTHQDSDTASCASIFSDPFARKHLRFLCPPNGWQNDDERWTIRDFTDRVHVQNSTRANGQSCVLNIILLASASGEPNDRCIGTTGFVTIDHDIGYLGIITDPHTTRMGYATEALYTSIVFAFDKLGVRRIVMQTGEENEEMRGWCEKIAGLTVENKKPKEINGYTFTQYEYTFNIDQWNTTIKNQLESKMQHIEQQ